MIATSEDLQVRTARQGIYFFLAGVSVYLTSFFLPAVTEGPGTATLKGWECAWMALCALKGFGSLFLFACGLPNLLVLSYATLWISHRQKTLRRSVAFAAIGLIPASWIFMAMYQCTVLVGHVAWVAGILMITGEDIADTLHLTGEDQ
jgi:hypothetical protein